MKLVYDTHILLSRNLKKRFGEKIWFFLGMLQPALYLLLYMPLLKNVGNTSALPLERITQIFVPGMLIIMGISSLFVGFSFIPEIREGFITRLLVTPISRAAILLSFIITQVVVLFLQVIILLFIAFLLGLRSSFEAAFLSLILVALIGITMSSLSYTISIITRSEDALASIVNTLYLPIMLLSGIMLPISLAPDWLKSAARFNPFYYAVEASRALFLENYSAPVIAEGFGIMLLFAVISVWLVVKALRNMTS